MKTKLLTQIIVSLAVLFGLGGLCGYAMSSRVHSGRPAITRSQQWAERWIEHRMAEDFELLDATPDQQARMRASYEKLMSEFNAIQAEASKQITDAFKRHNTELMKQFTPEQRQLYLKARQERRGRPTHSL
jgi:hypothetical protein